MREVGGEVTAQTFTVLAKLSVEIPGRGTVSAWIVEGRDLLIESRTGLLGRTSLTATSLLVDLDQLRPRRSEVEALLAGGVRGRAPEGEDRALSVLWRHAAQGLLSPGADAVRAFHALLGARLSYVLAHEVGHVIDLRRLGSPADHPWRHVSRVATSGLHPVAVAARYEEVAELYALSESMVPAVGLLSLLSTLPIAVGSEAGRGELTAGEVARRSAVAVFRQLFGVEAETPAGQLLLGQALVETSESVIRSRARQRLVELNVLTAVSAAAEVDLHKFKGR